MTTTAIVIIGAVVLAVIVIAIVLASRSGMARRPSLRPLTDESRDRYANQWDHIETHFVDAPDEAVKEADALILAMLGERAHPLRDEKLPAGMQKARRLATGQEGKGGTEGMRLAMLEYRRVMEEYAGPVAERGARETTREPRERDDRREIAS
jgi:hypothetical protein